MKWIEINKGVLTTRIPIILLLSTLYISCENREPYEQLLDYSPLTLQDPYKLDSTILRNTNEYNWVSYLEISTEDSERIKREINEEIELMNVQSVNEYNQKYRSEYDSLYGFYINSELHFGWHYNKYESINGNNRMIGFTSYDFKLDTTTNKLIFSYWNE